MEENENYSKMSVALWVNLSFAIVISLIGFYKTFDKWFKAKKEIDSGFPQNQKLLNKIPMNRSCCLRLPTKGTLLVFSPVLIYIFSSWFDIVCLCSN